MNISDKLLRSFSDIINSSRNDRRRDKQNNTVYGTVVKENGNVSVLIDGSVAPTPASCLVGVDNGDRVDVLIKNHKAIITANHTSPAITKFGDVYVTMSPDGVIVGKLDEDEQPTGASILIDPTSGEFRVVDADGKPLARFGESAQLGRDDRPHSVTDANYFIIKDANNNDVAVFGANTSIKRLVAERAEVRPANGSVANMPVSAYDNNGDLAAAVRLHANPSSGRGGLYDSMASNWMVYSEPNGDIKARITPVQLYSGAIHPRIISAEETYTNASVPGLSSWSMVVAFCRVGLNYQHLVFIRGGSTESYMSYYSRSSDVTTRGGFKVDWANNRMQIRGLLGDDTQLITLYNVYGLLTY